MPANAARQSNEYCFMYTQPVIRKGGGVHGLGVQYSCVAISGAAPPSLPPSIAIAATAMAADDKKAETKAEKKPPSVCVGLDLNACGAKAECFWKQQITTKQGKTRKAHCRLKPRQQMAKKAV